MIIDKDKRVSFNLDEFDHALRILNNKMEEGDIEPIDLYAVGGFVCLCRGKREYTHDIDAYYRADSALERAIYETAEEVHNFEWLNNSVMNASYMRLNGSPTFEDILSMDGAFDEDLCYGRVRIHLASSKLIIYMKLISSREGEGKFDISDIVSLSDDFSYEEILDSIKTMARQFHYGDYRVSDLCDSFIIALWERERIDTDRYNELFNRWVNS